MPSRRCLRKMSAVLVGFWVLNSLLLISDLFLGGEFFGTPAHGDDDDDDDDRQTPQFVRRVPPRRLKLEPPGRFRKIRPMCETGATNSTTTNTTGNNNNNSNPGPCDDQQGRLENNPYDSQVRRNSRRQRRIARRDKARQMRNTTLALPKPVIVMGFPKAGTSSIFSFFKNQRGLEFKCQHWYCCFDQATAQSPGPGLMSQCMVHNLVHKRSIFDGCGDFDLYAEINGPRPVAPATMRKNRRLKDNRPGLLLDDGKVDLDSYEPNRMVGGKAHRIFFPQYFNIQEIHDHYPNATFILNTRPFDSWINSVQDWDDDLDWQFVNEFYQRGALEHLPKDRRNRTEMAEIMRVIYDRHHEKVRQFVKDHTSHTLVEVPILHPNVSEILGQAFGLNSSAWSHINSKESRVPRPFYYRAMVWAENLFLEVLDNLLLSFVFIMGTTCMVGAVVLVLKATQFVLEMS